ncbi:MAG: phage tail protein [Planctomycetota bacterium]
MRIEKRRLWIAGLLLPAMFATVLPGWLYAPPEALDRSQEQAVSAHKFLVEIDGIAVATLDSVSGLEAKVSVLEYRSGNSVSSSSIKIPGLVAYSNVILRASVTQTDALWAWYKKIVSGALEKRHMVITILDGTNNPVVRYKILNAWPCAWRTPDLHALVDKTALEEIELAIEGFEREGGR